MATVRRASTRARSAIFAPIGDEGRAVRVENRLAEAIRSGVLADGERLPSEPELASMLGVATVTAREALVALRAQGLVTTTRGRGGGSFVAGPRRAERPT
ncbi:winged helix-turn-helix domain-containing protein [Aeromicrobium sp. UC242_57]|uniref:winged helix-turn-helix domain-containing protein n=1 Tax=Aeromicrobium sp. UC242_57 TaxID=3374624 RepID=UPI0037995C79